MPFRLRILVVLPAHFRITPRTLYARASYVTRRVRHARMEPAEVEFLAEKELVTVVPNFSENRLYLISV